VADIRSGSGPRQGIVVWLCHTTIKGFYVRYTLAYWGAPLEQYGWKLYTESKLEQVR
jgi:hypothetical protein